MRLAIVDIGTNTSRLFIADVVEQRIARELLRRSRVTRLGAGVDATGRLGVAALEREHAVLADYAGQIADAGVDRAVAVMTSAVRDAVNGADFAADVARRYALETRILTGEQEAALTYRGATDEVDPSSEERILVIDIGGGSTEFVLGTGVYADFHVSTQAGVVRQADRHLSADPPAAAELEALADDVAATLAAAVPPARRARVERTLAVAGTPTSLAAIDLELDPYDAATVHGHRIDRPRIEAILARLCGLDLEGRRHVIGLHPERGPTIVPGLVILLAAMDLFGLGTIEVCDQDLLRGAALRYAAGG